MNYQLMKGDTKHGKCSISGDTENLVLSLVLILSSQQLQCIKYQILLSIKSFTKSCKIS